jgi:hypothetical protein
MKFKVKEIQCAGISFQKNVLGSGEIVNIKYNNETLEFQTPKVIIDSLIKENDHEYLLLRILPTQACKIFCSKLLEIEESFSKSLNAPVKTIFNGDHFTVKIPFKYSKPLVKVYTEYGLFNYYHLRKDTEVICLLTLDKIWINQYKEPNYNLTVKEVMVT